MTKKSREKAARKLRFSSSVAGRRLICPGSAVAEAEAPPVAPNDYTEEGTALHAIMEELIADYIENGKLPEFSQWIGIEHTSVDRDHGEPRTTKVLIDEDMVENGLEVAFQQFLDIEKMFGLENAEEVYLETACPYPGLDGQKTLIDFTCETPELIFILDWKFGRGYDVDANYNPQMAYNAVAAKQHLYGKADKPLVVVIIQPFNPSGGPADPCIWRPRLTDLTYFNRQLLVAEKNARGEKPRFSTSDECRFCNANGTTCPLIAYMQKRMAKLVDNPDLVARRLEEGLAMAPRVKKGIEVVTAAAHERLERGLPVQGFKLVAKQANRAWTSEEKAMGWGRRQGLVKADMIKEKFVSPAQMEGALKSKYKAVNAVRAIADKAGTVYADTAIGFKLPELEIPEKYVDTSFTGTTIAPEGSKKPTVKARSVRQKELADKLKERGLTPKEDMVDEANIAAQS